MQVPRLLLPKIADLIPGGCENSKRLNYQLIP